MPLKLKPGIVRMIDKLCYNNSYRLDSVLATSKLVKDMVLLEVNAMLIAEYCSDAKQRLNALMSPTREKLSAVAARNSCTHIVDIVDSAAITIREMSVNDLNVANDIRDAVLRDIGNPFK